MADLERNKQNIFALYDLAFNQCGQRPADDLYVGTEYVPYNASVEDGKRAAIDYFKQMSRDYPGKYQTVIAEGGYVVLHCCREWPGGQAWAGADIFRLNDQEKIVEHWDVLQIVPEQAANANANGMF